MPEAHFLETWSDARAFDGTVTIVQPLIAPLYGGKSAHDVLAGLSKTPGRSALRRRARHWKAAAAQAGAPDFEAVLAQGRARRRRRGHARFAPKTFAARRRGRRPSARRRPPAPGLEVAFRPDPTVYDGRFANNGWLQELPKPFTKLDLGQHGRR